MLVLNFAEWFETEFLLGRIVCTYKESRNVLVKQVLLRTLILCVGC